MLFKDTKDARLDIAFLYTSKEQFENEMKKTMPIIIKKIPLKLRNQTIIVASKIKIIRNKYNTKLLKLCNNI